MRNEFQHRVRERARLNGLWLSLCHPTAAEICATAGFDWLLIDAEHAPNTIPTVLGQLRAIDDNAAPVVRPASNSPKSIGQFLDIGVKNLLIPMVDNAQLAHDLVAAVRYPPRGNRGHASALTRASAYGGDKRDVSAADENICILAQIETSQALKECVTSPRSTGSMHSSSVSTILVPTSATRISLNTNMFRPRCARSSRPPTAQENQ